MTVNYVKGVPRTTTTVKDNKGATPPKGTQNFIVDSGASQSTVTTTTIQGGSFTIEGTVIASTGAGQAQTLKVSGGSMTFNAVPPNGGPEVSVTCTVPMSIGTAN